MPQSLTLLFRSILVGRFYSLISVIGLAIAIAAVILVSALLQHEYAYEKAYSLSDRIYRLNWISTGTGDRFATMFNPFSVHLADDAAEIEQATRIDRNKSVRLCGKSTLLNIVGMLEKPTEGSFHFMGEDIATYEEAKLADIRRRRLGFVFQSVDQLQKRAFSLVENSGIVKRKQVGFFWKDIPNAGNDIAAECDVRLRRLLPYHLAESEGGDQLLLLNDGDADHVRFFLFHDRGDQETVDVAVNVDLVVLKRLQYLR